MSQKLISLVESKFAKSQLPEFHVGDTVDVSLRIREGGRERTQVFNGVVIARSGSGVTEMFTVRRIVNNEGVERKLMLHSPLIQDIKVRRSGRVRRAKLYYLRERVGKARRLRERRSGKGKGEAESAAEQPSGGVAERAAPREMAAAGSST